MPALLLRFCLRGGGVSRFLAAVALVGFAAVGFAADAFAQGNPRAPLNFSATPTGNNAVALSWTRDQRGSAPFGFIITYGRDGGAVTLDGVTYSGGGTMTINAGNNHYEVVSGLAGYEEYRFTVRAAGYTWRLVLSPAVSAVATPVSPPFAPSVSVVAGEGLISLHLTRRGLAPVESFVVRITNADYLSAWNAGVNIPATQSANFAVTPLFDIYPPSSGDAYTVIIRANNASGAGMPVTITANPLFGAPAAPETVAAAPLPGAASLRWRQNWNHAGGGFINAYIVSWSSGDQSRIVGGSAISGGATIDAAGNIANDASVLSSLVPANRQLSVAGWRSAVVPMPGNAPVTVAIRAHSRSPYSPQSRRLGAPISVVVTTFSALPSNIHTELVSRDNIRGEAVLRIHAGAADTSNYPPYYYRLRHFTVGLAEENFVADHTISLAGYAPIAPTVLITVSNLAPGVRHEFYGQACQIPNCASRAGYRHYALNMPERAPLPPQSLVAVPGDGQVSLSWSPPSTINNAGEVLSYFLYNGNIRFDVLNPQITSHVFRDLNNHEDIVFRVYAVNAAGVGLAATITARVGAPAPGVPYPDTGDNYLYDENRYLIASAGVFRGIARASPAGAPVPVPTESWEFEFSAAGDIWTITTNLSDPASTLTVSSGLQGGVLHTIRAVAVGRFGKTHGTPGFFTPPIHSGAELAERNELIQSLAASVIGGDKALISWSAPDLSVSGVFGYRLEAFANTGPVSVTVVYGNAKTATLSNMPSGKAIRVELAVYLDGEWEAPVATYFHMPPAAPRNFSGRFSSLWGGRAVLRWDAATSSLPLNHYLTYGYGSVIVLGGNVNSYNVTGLGREPGSRVFGLYARNSVGQSEVVSVTVVTPPPGGAPPGISTRIDPGVADVIAEVFWRPPPGSEEHTIVVYQIKRDNRPISVIDGRATVFREVVQYGRGYVYTLGAFNANGNNASAVITIDTPPTAPDNLAVAGVSADPANNGKHRISVQFDPAVSHLSLTGYDVYETTGKRTLSADSRQFTSQPEDLETLPVIRMRARNAAGAGPFAAITVGRQPPANAPSTPIAFTAVYNNGAIEFSWRYPGGLASAIIDGLNRFELFADRATASFGVTSAFLGQSGGVYFYTLSSPQGYGKRLIRIRAINQGGVGSADASALVFAPPAAPRSLAFAPGLNQVALNWRPADDTSGMPILRYELFYNGVSVAIRQSLPADPLSDFSPLSGYTIAGLSGGMPHRLTLRAVNAAGAGPHAVATASVLPPPAAASGFRRENLALGRLDLLWNAGASPSVSVLWQSLQYNGISLSLAAGITSVSVSGLSNGGFHLFTVRAHSAAGAGAPAVLSVRMPPDAPKNLVAAVGLGVATLSWDRPNGLGSFLYYQFGHTSFAGGFVGHDPGATSYAISNLPNGGTEEFALWVVNTEGAGETAYITVAMPPAAPVAEPSYGGFDKATYFWREAVSDLPIYFQEVSFRGALFTLGGNVTSLPVAGLENGQTYAATLRAFSAAGAGAFVTLSAYTPPPAPPNAPTSVFADGAYGVVTLTWGAPASDGRATITAYIVSYKGAATATQGRSFTLSGLFAGETVVFTVQAQNSLGAGAAATAYGIARAAPAAPANLRAKPDDTLVSLTWGAPTRLNGAALLGYEVVYNGQTQSLGATATSHAATGLNNGEAYSFGVYAKSDYGNGATATATATPLARPPAPASFVAQAPPQDKKIVINWGAPASVSTMPPVLFYVVDINGAATLTLAAGARAATLERLVNGKIQTLALRAKNRIGLGAATTLTAAAQGPPRALLRVTTFPHIREAHVWAALSPEEGDSAVTVYFLKHHDQTLSIFPDERRDERNISFFEGELGALFRVYNLPGGWNVFTVFARNKYGDGDEVVVGENVIAGVPPPRNLHAKTGDRVVTLIWERPYVDDKFYGYFIAWGYYPKNSERYLRYPNVYDPGPFTAVITAHLTNSIEQRFIMQALPLEQEVFHAAHFITFYATPGLPPGDVPFFAASSNFDGRIPIAWGEAANDEGSPLTGYELSYNGVIQTLAPTARSAALEGLVNGQTHSLTLRAASTSGRGPPIVAIATPRAPPTPPTSLAAAGAHGAITVIWGAPQNDNGASVTAYFIAYKSATATVAGLALTLSNLSAGETLIFVARAANSIGISDAATAAAIVYDSPSAPTNLRAQRGNGAATITWGAPTRLNGSRLRGYWLDYGGQRQSLDANARAHTATALANGAVYLFSLYANSEYGNGATATASAKPATTPAAPANLRAAFADRAIALQWVLATTAPANGGEPVTAYIIRYGANKTGTLGAVASVVVSGLTNGETVAFSVYAVNALGESATPATVNEYPNTTPAAPASLRALEGDGVVTLVWSPPAANGGAPLLGYRLVYDGQTINLGKNAPGHLLPNLTNGKTITFAVGARNRGGLGAMASVVAVPRGKPSAPTGLNAVGKIGFITLVWSAPDNDNGATVTGYAIHYRGTATATAGRSFVLSNLSAGETVNFTVRAINELGAGAAAIAQGIEGGNVPTAPANLRAQRGNGAATLSWGAPAQLNDAALRGYEVVYNGQTQSVGASATSHIAGGLANGSVYWFRVYAKSDNGDGAAAFVSAKPATTPAAPADLSAAFADGAVALQWALVTGAANGGEPVTGYVVRYGENKTEMLGAVSSVVVLGLSNGETIVFSVYAVNAAGKSAAPATVEEYASGAPSAPTGLQAQDGDGVITLQWGAPANNGGAPILRYIVKHTGGALTASVAGATLTGVVNGAPITASVFAVNRAGRGAAFAVTATAATTPAAPTNLQAAAGESAITLTWGAPANTGGAAITAYSAEWGGRSTLALGDSFVVSGLANGETLRFTLRARNRKGAGAPASVVAAIAIVAPSAPTSAAAAGAYGVITLTWGAPAANGGAAITAYVISYKDAAAAVAAAARSFTLSSLSAGETVNFAVQAQNSVGLSEGATAQGVARDAPSAPTNLRAQRGNGAVTLLWGAPARLNGAALQGYEIAYNGQTQSVGANATSHAATGLNNGEVYNFGVYAKSDYGDGATATASATPATTPVTPANLRAAFADAAITLRWNLATGADTGGAPITAHIIDYVENKETIFHLTGNTIRYFINRAATVGAVDSAVIAGLSNGDTVSFSVYAVNAAGRSAAPATISEYASAAPAAPTGLQTQDGNAVITAQWGAPANNGGAAITGYVVEYTGGLLTTSPAGRGVTLTGVANGAPIAISVFAFNRAGRGAASAITATAATTPAAPASLQAQDGDGAITLQWSAAANNGGATVTGYVVEHTGGTATASVAAIAITGLTNGEPITAKVFAINRVGIGAASAPITATAATTASAPISLQAAEGDGAVTLTWRAPANNGGATITAYSARWGGQSTLVFGASLVVSGLTNGQTITFAVGARNRKGAGAAASVAAAGRGKPSAPTSVFADGAYGVVTLTWGAPANSGGATVTAYIVNYKGAEAEAEAAGRSFTLSNLFAGETVAFTVRAVNSFGVGAGATAQGIARDAPAAPTSLRALRGDGVATLTWAAPARLNGATVRGYEVLYDGQTQSVGASATAHTATALNNGVEYEFRIYAKSDYGDGATATARATPAARPATPANLRAAFADGAITLQWALATAAVAEPVTGYVVRYGATAKFLGAVASVVVDGLTNGETINFSVYAVNAVGESALPATISEYASATPAAPTGLLAQDGNGVITLQWNAPSNNGGAAITAHIVEYTGGAITAATTRATLTGLTNGAPITAKVFAVNRGGRGAASAPVVATAATTPAAPAGLQAAEGNGVVTLTWGAPADNGGATITAYMAEWGGRSSLVSGVSLVVSGLTNGETVSFTIRARNRKGLGAAASIAAAGRGKPSEPTGVNAVGSNGNITVTWNAPTNDNGAAVTAYIVSYKGTMTAAQGLSFTLSGLSAGETVRFTVQAVNSVGISDGATAQGIARDAPTAPTSLQTQRGDGVVTLTWGAPAQLNGATLQGYEIVYASETQSVGANATIYTATGLSNGTEYEFRVYAKSDYGNGAAATASAKPATTPSAPASLRAAFADSAITLQWDLVTGANTGGEPVTAYIIRHGAKALTVGAVNFAVMGSLTNGETITFSVYAANAVGESATPATISEYANTTPAAPTGLQAQDGNGVITLQWSAPSDNGGAAVTGYVVEYTGGTLTAATNRATLTGLTNGAPITAKVFAVNRGGRGAASAPVVATAATTPAAPTDLQAQDGNGVITLQWSVPADNGGAAITAHIVEYTDGTLTVATNLATLTGLTNGAPITAKVFAVNRVGGGAASAPVVATAATTASAPTNLQVAEGDGVVTLTWGAPNNTGGAVVTAYMAEWNGQSTLVSGVSLVVSGLTNGETVSFTLRARNRKGSGVAASISAAGRGKPDAPTGVNAVGSNGNITVIWNAPTNDNGAAVTGYIVSYKGIATAVQGRGFTLSGLSAGETVRFTVQAVNSVGVSDGATAEGIARDAPTAPTNLQAQQGNGVVTLTWGAPAQLNGATLQGYEIAYGAEMQSVGANATGYTATGLSNGTTYEFRVYAKSDYGNGAAAITTAKPATTPSAPASLRAAFADSAITLQWDLITGADTGGEPVTAYIIRRGAKASTVGAINSAVIGSLTNGETVVFSVYAVNAVGESAAPATISEYPNTTPAAPTALQAQDGNGVITLQWNAPADNGGAAITAHIVEYTGGTITAATTRATLTGLTNGAPITAKVFAVNRGGRGAASAPVVAMAATTPAAPTGLQAQDGNAVITLQWSASNNNGGAAVTGYVVEYTGGTLTATTNRATLTGLINGAPITAKVFAVNRVGGGAASAPVVATAATTASAPTNLQVAGGDGVVTLTWGAPNNTGGAAVTAYMAEWGGQSTLVSEDSLVVSGLTNGETVSFTLRARNRKGAGAAASIAAAGRGKPSAPTAVNAVGSNGNITVTWNAPANDNGAAVTAYILSYKGIATAVQGRGFTLSGLSAGETVRFTVQAVNSVGVSDGATAEGIARDAPTAPTNLSAQRGNGVVTLAWGAPAQLNGATLQGYEIAYGSETQSVGANATGYTATGLSNGITYEFRVYAKSDYGNGAAAIITAKPATTPSAPDNLRAAFADRAITLQWDLVSGADTGGEPVTAYIIRYGANKASTVGAVNSAVIDNLTNGETVAFSVYAVNAVGESPTPATISEYANTTPAAPTGLQAQDGNAVITLQWSAPNNNGGAAVTGYVVEYTGGTLTAATNRATLTGLINGAPITAKVFAVNRVGGGAASAPVVATAAATASAPTNLQAAEGDGVVTLTWGEPSNTGGAAVTAYVAEWGGQSTLVSEDSLVVSGLTNGETVSFTLRARSRKGLGAAASIAAAGRGKPSAPTAVNAAGSNGNITVTWNAPANDNGAAVTGYIVSYKGIATAVQGRGFTLSGLFAGETVRFTVQAVNSVGASDGATAEGIARDAPTAPTNLQAQRGNGVVTLTWGAPAQLNGAALQGYEIVYGGQTQSVGANATGYTATGLSNGTTYEFRVYAKSNYGNGAAALTTAKPATTPNAPSNLRAAFADSAITLQWDLATGADTGGEPITAYIISYGANKAATVGAVNFVVVDNLTNGEVVAFSVYAVNAVGESAAPATINEYASAPPGAPQNLRAQTGDGVITLQWNAPADNGGATITGYIVEYTGGALTLTAAALPRATLADLTNGAEITMRVFAVNRAGRGAASAPRSGAAATTPAAVTALYARGGDKVIELNWGAPNDGGAEITRYVLYVNGAETLSVAGITRSAALGGLKNGREYTLGIRAENSVGLGPFAQTTQTPASRPAAPQGFSVVAGNGELALFWRAPASDGGAPITAYIAFVNGAAVVTLGAARRSATLDALTNGKTYTLGLAAANRGGAGAQAITGETPYTVPAKPKNVFFKEGKERITIFWDLPESDNGRPVVGYEVSLEFVDGAVTMTVPAGDVMSIHFTVGASAMYSVYVRARNLAGYGSWALAVDEDDFLLDEEEEKRTTEADNSMLPAMAGALSRQWGKALGGRLGAGGGAGGANLRALGASFSLDDATRGVAELLRKHGGAIANGEKIDESVLRDMQFAFLPGNGGGGKGAGVGGAGAPALGKVGLWGGASYTNLKDEAGEILWDGRHSNYHAGIERALDDNKVVGVMLTRDEIKTKYRTQADGDYRTYNLRAGGAHPYFLWNAPDGGRRLWAAFGYAAGKAQTAAGAATKTRDLRAYSAFGGYHGLLWSDKSGGVLDLQADAAAARVEVKKGGSATAHNLRALLEARREFRDTDGNAFLPFLRAGTRLLKDGEGVAAGWEALAGMRWTNAAGWRAELAGGASGLSNGQKEWSVEGALSKRADALGKGLSLDLRAQYGGKAKDVNLRGDFWRPLVAEDNAGGGGFGFGADLGYGITRAGALWRPYFGATFGEGGEYRAGLAWRQLLRGDVEARAGMEAKRLHDKTQLNVNMGVNY